MAETPKKSFCSPKNSKNYPQANAKPSPSLTPATPQTLPPRRSTRRTSLHFNQTTPLKATDRIESPKADSTKSPRNVSKFADSSVPKTSRKSIFKAEDPGTDSPRNGSSGFELSNVSISAKRSENSRPKEGAGFVEVGVSFSPLSPDKSESTGRKRKRLEERTVVTRAIAASKSEKSGLGQLQRRAKRRVYYKKVVYDGGQFEVGDNVYVKRREGANSDDEEPEMEECRMCFKAGRAVMIECDDCLGGYHLKCLKPPLKEVPEGDWICGFCEARKLGKEVELPLPPQGKKRMRTMREKLLSSDLWAAHIER